MVLAALLLMCPLIVNAELMTYYGMASITSPANLGVIDLAFTLDVSGTAIQPATSYIMLDKTLLFPKVNPQVCTTVKSVTTCIEAGPRVSGSVSPTSFSLTTANLTQPPDCTDCFISEVSKRTVLRKVELISTAVTNGGNSLTGNYTETITGLTPKPVVVSGMFFLVRPTVQTIVVDMKDQNGDGCIDLNEIRASGASSEVLEFSDMSQALHLYYHPTTLKICTKPNDLTGEQTIKAALSEFHATQKK